MAGRVASGPLAADAALFEGAVWCLVPGQRTPPEAMAEATALVESFGAAARPIDAALHDALVAEVSHLPYLLAVACMAQVGGQEIWPQAAEMAATGFGYATNLVGKDPRMYADIMLTNTESVLRALDGVMEELGRLRAAIAAEDVAQLLATFEQAQQQRRAWLRGKPAVQRALGGVEPASSGD
jgi:prephenate dehydrogenase